MMHAIKEQKVHVSKEMNKAKRTVRKEMFSKVPSHAVLSQRKTDVIERLSEDLQSKTLSLNNLKALNFFLMQVRLNTTSGPILKLKWETFENKLSKGLVHETDDHKTGHVYDVALMIQPDQVEFLWELKRRCEQESGQQQALIFANGKNNVETRMPQLLNLAFAELFGDDPSEVRFNANSIRKFWEMRVRQMGVAANLMNAHSAQTAHSSTTGGLHYVGLELQDRIGIINIYNRDLDSTQESTEQVCPEEIEDMSDESELEADVPVPQPVRQPPTRPQPRPRPLSLGRVSLNSTRDLVFSPKRPQPNVDDENDIEEDHAEEDREQDQPPPKKKQKGFSREKYLRSMSRFRDTEKHIWTTEEMEACKAFANANNTITFKDLKWHLKDLKINLSDTSCKFVYQKIISAFQVAGS